MVAAMHFSQDDFAANSIRAYATSEITVNDKIIRQSVLLSPDSIDPWPPRSIDELTTTHLQRLLDFQPEIVILGTGPTLRFPAPALLAIIQTRGIGIEVMAHDAACRTFNVLLAEDRRVLAALMMAGT